MSLSRHWKRSRGLFSNAPRPLPGGRAPRQRAAGPALTPSWTSSLSPSLSPSLTPSLSPSVPPSLPPSQLPSLTPSLPPWLLPSLPPELSPSCRRPESSGDDGCEHSVDEATAEEEIDIRSRCSAIEFNEGKGSNQKYLLRKGTLWWEQREMTVQVKEEHCGDFGVQTTAVFQRHGLRMCALSSHCSHTAAGWHHTYQTSTGQ